MGSYRCLATWPYMAEMHPAKRSTTTLPAPQPSTPGLPRPRCARALGVLGEVVAKFADLLPRLDALPPPAASAYVATRQRRPSTTTTHRTQIRLM